MTHASLFSGIGGFDLAAQWMGWENLFHCEWNPFCQTVLKYHWPNAHTYTDITTADFTPFHRRVDILTGGFPCQPFSTAGQRKGTADDRYLWPQMLRAIREIAPRFVVGENVDGIFTWNHGLVFETVCADLEDEGYQVQPYRIPACATGAPHRRDRWWFVAHAIGERAGREGGKIEYQGRPAAEDRQPCLRHTQRAAGASGAQSAVANAGHLELQPDNPGRCPQGRPDTEHRGSIADDFNPTGEGLEVSQQARRKSTPAQDGAGLERRTTDIDFNAPNPRRSHAQNGLHGQQPGRQASEHRDSLAGGDRWSEHWIEAATRLCVLDDGLPRRLDAVALSTPPKHAAGKWRKESLRAAGNAIVPQVAYTIYQAIQASLS